MKISKIVKEYIIDQVNEAKEAAMDSDPIIQEHQAIVKRMQEESSIIHAKHKQEWTELAEKFGTVPGYNDRPDYGRLPMAEAVSTRKRLYREAADDKIKDILLTLELGGTREDLDKMLTNLKF